MTWQICVPYRSKSDGLADVGSSIRALADAEDRACTAQLILAGAEAGLHTAGDLLEVLEEIERRGASRKALDVLRKRAGLETVTEIEQRERQGEMLRNTPRPLYHSRILECAADGCSAIPRDRSSMAPVPVACRRWWCAEHRHLAQPGDDESSTHFENTATGGIKIVNDPEPEPLPGIHPEMGERIAQEARDAMAAFEQRDQERNQ